MNTVSAARMAAVLGLACASVLFSAAQASEFIAGRFGFTFNGREYGSAQAACSAMLQTLSPPQRLKAAYPPDEDGNVRCVGGGTAESGPFDQYSNGVSYELICPPGTRAMDTDRPRSDPRRCECEPGQVCTAQAAATGPAASHDAAGAEPAAWSAVPPPAERGMTAIDDVVFQGLAMNLKLIFLVRDSNSAAVRFTGEPGYAPKPQTLKAKTIKGDPAQNENVGLAAANPADPRLKEMLADDYMTYPTYLLLLRKYGFAVGPKPDFLVLDRKTGAKFYSDIDLHGVYDQQGRQRWDKSLMDVLNARLKDRLIQHGPHDCWPERNTPEAGQNAGPQPPVTVYLPDGTMRWLKTKNDMERFYARQKLPWPYAKGAKAKWCD